MAYWRCIRDGIGRSISSVGQTVRPPNPLLSPNFLKSATCLTSSKSDTNVCEGNELEHEKDNTKDEQKRLPDASGYGWGKKEEAQAIGYKVVGRVDPSKYALRKWEPVFAVIQIGSHQFKVSTGDCIYVERLKHCDINDRLSLRKILLLGSKSQTIIGRPFLSDAVVHAVVEEHEMNVFQALDAKVIIFKKKRRKNYRRTKGHRQELTRLRIVDIRGIEKGNKAKTAS